MMVMQYYKSLDKYKKAFWIYLFLLFIEGSMRKWFMPSLSNVWMMCREPIVIWTVLSLMNTKYLKSIVAKSFMVIGCIMFLTTLTLGHQNVMVALFGFRIWFLHIPYIFIMSQKLNREDLIRVCQFLMLIFLPMTLLYVAQWAAPPSSWLNASVGGIVAEEGSQAVYGAVRPSGTFILGLGAAYYNPVVVSIFVACMYSSFYKKELMLFKKELLFLAISIVVTLAVSVSRGTVVQSAVCAIVVALFVALTGKTTYLKKLLVGFSLIYILFTVVSKVDIGGKNLMAPITDRFETAAAQEGGSSGIMETRVLEPYKFWNDKGKLLDPPLFGYGIGAGSNYGTQTLHIVNSSFDDSTAWGLGEWSSQIVTNEMGFLFGGVVFCLRMGLCISLFFISIKKLFVNSDVLPISLWTLSINNFVNGNINLTMTLGWIVVVMILLLTSVRTSENIEFDNNLRRKI